MKKLISLVMAAAMAFSMVACGGSTNSASTATSGSTDTSTATSTATTGGSTDVAFITDVGNIDDHSFNQYSYEGVTNFCTANGLKANYFRPTEDTDAARHDAIVQAANSGAKVVVMAGYLFAPALEQVQAEFHDVQFLALDVSSADLPNPAANTAMITYQEEQAGYLAGYAAVKDGYTKLGFLGGLAVPPVVRYGYGFVQGADAAANELGVDVDVKYWYSSSFVANDDIKAKMDSWYADGTEVVFACGGGIYSSAISAAEASTNGGKVIGVDVDQSDDGSMVITSATKSLAHSVELALADCQANNWKWSEKYGAKETKLGVAEECVALPMETSRFESFTAEQYDELYAKLADGSVAVNDSADIMAHPETTKVTVDWQE